MASSGDSLPDLESERKGRGHWSHKCDYLFTVTGYAIGLSNVWRFPYLCYINGGGAFLVPYLLTLVLVGIPLFFLETAVGQFSSSSCLAVFSVCPAFKGLGLASLAINLVTLTYCVVLVSYPLLFLAHSFSWDLPWASCGNSWNSPNCTAEGDVKDGVSSADEFFHQKILRVSSGIDDLSRIEWPVVIVTFMVFVFLFFCVFKGIKILGKVVWLTVIFPFVMLFILLIRGVTLPGATDGIYFYIYPEFNRLKEMKVWAAAAIQIFYSLGPGWGSLICFGSYNKFNNRCTRDALIVPVLNSSTSILAGFVVFSVLGFMAKRAGVSIEELAVAGAGRTVQDLQLMIGRRIGYGWWGTWLVVTPLVLLGILMNTVLNQSGAGYRGQTFPTWAQSTGWVIALTSIQFIPTYFLYYFCFRTAGSFKQRIKSCLSPSAAWGPAHPSHREKWMQHRLKYPLRHRLLHPNLCAENTSPPDVFLNIL
ncbi:sodium-dependent noradrenaline transporter-like [Penaeus monodon]|uniref:sodium-dependent noradrenaline transporter-like n=1 Tax=Penaeus monodon TaxID=6687 RepID=UPI0018A743F7|nr:sodium-dependent noradrenaline transporter-like [Penaeus monodon]